MQYRIMMLVAFVVALATPSFVSAMPQEAAPAAGDTGTTGAAEGETGDAAKAADTGTTGDAAGTTGGEEAKAATIETDDQAAEAMQALLDAAKGGQWSAAAALLLMLLVYAGRKLKVTDKLKAEHVPWATAGLGMAGYMAAAMLANAASLTDALMGGFMTGASAVGLWELLGRRLLARGDSEESSE
jgi:hypothetical protein